MAENEITGANADNAVNTEVAASTDAAAAGAVTVTTGTAGQDENLLKQIRDMTARQLFWQRITSCAVVGVFLVLLAAVVILVPKVTTTLSNIDRVTMDVSGSVGEINTMVAEMTDASSGLGGLVEDNAEKLTEAVNNLAGIDFEGLNKAIQDLQDAVGPMAAFFNRFK